MKLRLEQLRYLAVAMATVSTIACARRVPAQGQSEREGNSNQLRNDCRLAAQTLEKGHPAPKTEWALEVIGLCEQSAGPALAARWAAPPTDSLALEQLILASRSVADGRIFSAVDAIARNAGSAQTARLSALRVLAGYIDPYEVVYLSHVRPSPDSGRTAHVDHAKQIAGSVPLPATATASIRALFSSLATTDADPVVRFAGRQLRKRFCATGC
jgi:hypothetical protein